MNDWLIIVLIVIPSLALGVELIDLARWWRDTRADRSPTREDIMSIWSKAMSNNSADPLTPEQMDRLAELANFLEVGRKLYAIREEDPSAAATVELTPEQEKAVAAYLGEWNQLARGLLMMSGNVIRSVVSGTLDGVGDLLDEIFDEEDAEA